jgi:hypothetical protein
LKLFRGKEKDVIILRATDEDVGICVDMIAEAMGSMSGQPVNRTALEQTLKTPNVILLVGKKTDRVVGMISGLAFPTMVPPPRIDFLNVLDDESARKGLHNRLIDGFIDELKRRVPNAPYVDTTLSTTNPQFVAMYSMKGFCVVGFTRGHQSHNDVAVLRKDLSEESSLPYAV